MIAFTFRYRQDRILLFREKAWLKRLIIHMRYVDKLIPSNLWYTDEVRT